MLNLNVSAVHLDSTCGTNGVKKSSDETAGSQSLFMNNTEHSTFSANSLVRKTEISLFKNKNRKKLQMGLNVKSGTKVTLVLFFFSISDSQKWRRIKW